MVIGHGLIAIQFRKWQDRKDVIIFASGVSNSKETNNIEFQRERELIEKYKSSSAVFIYFSTCSIYDPMLVNSPYVKHKRNVESLIRKRFEHFLILRLPNIIGITNNPHTLFNFFYYSIKNGEHFRVQKRSTRYFLDIELLEQIVCTLLDNSIALNRHINIAFDNSVYVLEIVREMEKIIGKKASIELLDTGSKYSIPNSLFLDIFKKSGATNFTKKDFFQWLVKYVKLTQNLEE